MSEGGVWVKVASAAELAEREVMGVEACGVAIALYSAEGQVFATYDMCSHGKARLSEGYLEELEIECPLHQGTFDIRTGQALKAPCVVPVRSFQTRLEEDDIFVFVED